MIHQHREAEAWDAGGQGAVAAGGAARSKEDPKRWIVRVDLLDDTRQLRVMWVELRFDQVLPEPGQWPSLN